MDTGYEPKTIWETSVSFFDPTYIDDQHPTGQRNLVSFHYYPSDEPEESQIDQLKDKFAKYVVNKKKQGASAMEYNVKPLGKHRWWLTWFAHETDQKFNSPDDALADFRKFCEENKFKDYDRGDKSEFIWCPMGAEDSYRHQVCDCEHCARLGKTIVTH